MPLPTRIKRPVVRQVAILWLRLAKCYHRAKPLKQASKTIGEHTRRFSKADKPEAEE